MSAQDQLLHWSKISNWIVNTDTELRNLFNSHKNNVFFLGNIPLIFGQYAKDSSIRVREQEAKQLLILNIARDLGNGYWFSVETPTQQKYRFSGQSKGDGQSARIDMTLYTKTESRTPIMNVELKCSFKDENSEKNDHITKDFVKLLREKPDGLLINIARATGGQKKERGIKTAESAKRGMQFALNKAHKYLSDRNWTFSKRKTLRLFLSLIDIGGMEAEGGRGFYQASYKGGSWSLEEVSQ